MFTKVLLVLIVWVALFNYRLTFAETGVVTASNQVSGDEHSGTAQGTREPHIHQDREFEDKDDDEDDEEIFGNDIQSPIERNNGVKGSVGHTDHNALDEDLLHHTADDDSNLHDDDNQLDTLGSQKELGSINLFSQQISRIAEKVRTKAREDLGEEVEENKNFFKKYRTYIAIRRKGYYYASKKYQELVKNFTSGNYQSIIDTLVNIENEGFVTVSSTGKSLLEMNDKSYFVIWSGSIGAGRVYRHAHLLQDKTKVNTYCMWDLYNFKLVLNTINAIRKEVKNKIDGVDTYYNDGHWARIVLICRKHYIEIGRRMKANFILILYENAYVFYNYFDIHLYPLVEKALEEVPTRTLDVIMGRDLDILDSVDVTHKVDEKDAVSLKNIKIEERPIAIEFHQIDQCRTKFNGAEKMRDLFATHDSVSYPDAFSALDQDLNYAPQKCIRGRPIFFKNETQEHVAVISDVSGENDELVQYQLLIGPHENVNHFFSKPNYLAFKIPRFLSESDVTSHADALQRYVSDSLDDSINAKKERIEGAVIRGKDGVPKFQFHCSVKKGAPSATSPKCQVKHRKNHALAKSSQGIAVATTYTRYMHASKNNLSFKLGEVQMRRVLTNMANRAVKFLRHGRTISTTFGLLSAFKIILFTRTSNFSSDWSKLKNFELQNINWEQIKSNILDTLGASFDGVDLVKAAIGRRRTFFSSIQHFSKFGVVGQSVSVIAGTANFFFEMAKAVQANSGLERAFHLVNAVGGLIDAGLSVVTFISALAGKLAVIGGPTVIGIVVLVLFSSVAFVIQKTIDTRKVFEREDEFKQGYAVAFRQPWSQDEDKNTLFFAENVTITVVNFDKRKLRRHVLEETSHSKKCSNVVEKRYPNRRKLTSDVSIQYDDEIVIFVLPRLPSIFIANNPKCIDATITKRGRVHTKPTIIDIIMGQTDPKVLVVPPFSHDDSLTNINSIEHVFHGGGTVHKIQLADLRNIKINDNHKKISTWIIDTKALRFPLHGYRFSTNFIEFINSAKIIITNPLHTKLIVHDRDGGVFQLYNGEVKYAPMINYDRIAYTRQNIIDQVVQDNKFHDRILIINQYMVEGNIKKTYFTNHPPYYHYTNMIEDAVEQDSTLIQTTGTDSYFYNSEKQAFWYNPEDSHIPSSYYRLKSGQTQNAKLVFRKSSFGVEMILEINDFFQQDETLEADQVHLYIIWNGGNLTLRAISASEATYNQHVKGRRLQKQTLKDKLQALNQKFNMLFVEKMNIGINSLLTIMIRKSDNSSTFTYIKSEPWTYIQYDIDGSDLPDDFTYAGRILKNTPHESFIFYSATKKYFYHISAQIQTKYITQINGFQIQNLHYASIVDTNHVIVNAAHINYHVDIAKQTLIPVSITDRWFDLKANPSKKLRKLMLQSQGDTLPIIRTSPTGKHKKPLLNPMSGFYIQDENVVAITLNLDQGCHFVGYLQRPLLAVAFCPREKRLKALPTKSLLAYQKIISSENGESQVPVKPLGDQSWDVSEVKMEDDRLLFNTTDGFEAELLSDRQIKIIGYNRDVEGYEGQLKSLISDKCENHICRDAIYISVKSEIKKWFHKPTNQFFASTETRTSLIGTSKSTAGQRAKLIMYQPSNKVVLQYDSTSAKRLVEVDDVIVKSGVVTIYGSSNNPEMISFVAQEHNKLMMVAMHPNAVITLNEEALNHYQHLEIISGANAADSKITIQFPPDWLSKLNVEYDADDLLFVDESGFTLYLNLQTDYTEGANTIIKASAGKEVNAKMLITKFKENNNAEFNLAEYLASI